VPSGDPPLGMATAHELFRALVSNANLLPVPSGQWPDGTGGSPVLPLSTSEFGLMQFIRSRADSPNAPGDFAEKDAAGRTVQVRIIGRYALTFWADPAVSEDKVTHIKLAHQ
jgi:hypothetical protein